MTYKLGFRKSAEKEWRKLAPDLRAQFERKLKERLKNPHIPASRLRGGLPRYKIKLRSSGYRLVYEVRDEVLLVFVISIGKRERGDVYRKAEGR